VIFIDGRQASQGWNSPPKGTDVSECKRKSCQKNNDMITASKDGAYAAAIVSGMNMETAICTHAEANAIANLEYMGNSTRNAKEVLLATSVVPCSECAKLIVSIGVTHVITFGDYDSPYTKMYFKNAKIKLEILDRKKYEKEELKRLI